MYKIGAKVKVHRDNDNDGYNSFRNKTLIVTGVYRNDKEHPGYDMGVYPEKLYEFKATDGTEIHCALYEYELEKA